MVKLLQYKIRTNQILISGLIFLPFIFYSLIFIESKSACAGKIKDLEIKIQQGILPEWSRYVQGEKFGDPKGKKYERFFGPTWSHIHHYIWGLDEMNQAFSNYTNIQNRNYFFTSAINNFDYVIQRSTPNFILLPDILFNKGITLSHMNKYVEACMAFKRAINIRNNYIPAYVALSDLLSMNGLKKEAKQIILQGLKFNKSSEILQKKLIELDAAT